MGHVAGADEGSLLASPQRLPNLRHDGGGLHDTASPPAFSGATTASALENDRIPVVAVSPGYHPPPLP